MGSVQAVAGGHMGYVRAVFSARCRGFALPVDLVRANLRAVSRVLVRRRVAEEFAGYLVTDSRPVVVPNVWREDSGRVVVLGGSFSGRAQAGDDEQLRSEFAGSLAGAAIDAPVFLLSGSVHVYEPAGCRRCAAVGRYWRAGE